MTSTKPYLLRAIYDWSEDNGLTPQLLVNAAIDGVVVPREHVVDGQIILNISATAVRMQVMDNDVIKFSARFSGVEQHIVLPMAAIAAIFARENSQGIFFEELDDAPDPDDPDKQPKIAKPTASKSAQSSSSASRKKAGHLKIIK